MSFLTHEVHVQWWGPSRSRFCLHRWSQAQHSWVLAMLLLISTATTPELLKWDLSIDTADWNKMDRPVSRLLTSAAADRKLQKSCTKAEFDLHNFGSKQINHNYDTTFGWMNGTYWNSKATDKQLALLIELLVHGLLGMRRLLAPIWNFERDSSNEIWNTAETLQTP